MALYNFDTTSMTTSCNSRSQVLQEKDDYVAWVEDINPIKRDDKKPAHILAHHAKFIDDYVEVVIAHGGGNPSFLEVVIAHGVLHLFFVFFFSL